MNNKHLSDGRPYEAPETVTLELLAGSRILDNSPDITLNDLIVGGLIDEGV